MPKDRNPKTVDWGVLGFSCSRNVLRTHQQEGSRERVIITAFDDNGIALPYFRITLTRMPPFFIIVDGYTVAMTEAGDVWYRKGKTDLRSYGLPRLDEHTRTA